MISILKVNERWLHLLSKVGHHLACRTVSNRISTKFELRRLERREIPQVLENVNKEGRNHTLAYLLACYDLFPQGWWGVVEEDQVLGSFAMHDFEDKKTVMSGLLCVRRTHRGLGIGKLLNEHNTTLGKGKNAFVLSATPNFIYKQSFKHFQQTLFLELRKPSVHYKMTTGDTFKVVSFKPDLLPQLESYDTNIHPVPRTKYFHKVILGCAHSICVAVDHTHNVIGYGALRRANGGWRIAPLYAESDDVGQQLFLTLLNQVKEGELISTTTFDRNASALATQESLGFKCVMRTYLMYTISPPEIPIEKVFATASNEFSIC